MPAPVSTTVCAWCLAQYSGESQRSYTLAAVGEGYSWVADTGPVAEARRSDAGLWQVFDAGSGELAVTLVAIETGSEMRVTLLDKHARSLASVLVDPGGMPRRARTGRRGLGVVRNRRNEPLLAVYGDGPTGVHLVNREDRVVALASPVPGARGLDVVVTRVAAAPNPITLCGVLLALELARAGYLRFTG